MSLKLQWRHSLRTRVMLAVLVIFMCSVVLLSLIATRLLHTELQRLLGDQQAATVSLVAADISNHLQVRQDALHTIARAMGGTVLDNPASMQQFLEQRLLLQSLFNAGVYVTRLDGTVVTEVPITGRIGLNYLDKDHIATALKTGRASVGKPVVSQRLHIPIFAMTVPIRDTQGHVIGAVSGVTDLSQANFLDSVQAGSYGKSGGYILVAPQHRLFVTATANLNKMVMQPLPAPGINPVLDRRILGFDGQAVNVSSYGTEVLTSSARIPLAAWFLLATLPTKEAFAPVRTLEDIVLSVATILTLLSGLLIWVMLQRLLSPLQTASKTLADYADKGDAVEPLPIVQHDEVGILIGSFNRVFTERLKAQAQLSQVLSEQSAILNSNINGIVKIKDRHFSWMNDACASMLGYTVAELIGQPTRMVYPNDDAYLAYAARAYPVMQSGDVFRTEMQFLRKDNTLRWFEMSGQLLCPGSDESIGSLVDISERIRSERVLQDSQDRLVRVQEGAHVGIWELNLTTGYAYWSPECERLYGLEPGTLKRFDDWRHLVHPDDLAMIDWQLASRIEPQEFFEVEYRLRLDKGGIRWILSKGCAQLDATGRPIKLSGINLDITDRKQMSAERDRLLRIVEEAPECISMADMQTRFVFLNKAGRKMLGVSDDVDISALTIRDVRPECELRHFREQAAPTALRACEKIDLSDQR